MRKMHTHMHTHTRTSARKLWNIYYCYTHTQMHTRAHAHTCAQRNARTHASSHIHARIHPHISTMHINICTSAQAVAHIDIDTDKHTRIYLKQDVTHCITDSHQKMSVRPPFLENSTAHKMHRQYQRLERDKTRRLFRCHICKSMHETC